MKGHYAIPLEAPTTANWYEKKTAAEMNEKQIRHRLCLSGPQHCPKCECLDACTYGQAAVRMNLHKGD